MLDVERVGRYIERGTIEIAPIAFMRGRTLNDSFVILDEAQNTTSEQMKMFLTRLGFGAKAVITGDITQIDLPTGRTSGLVEAMKVVGGDRGHLVRPLRRPRRRPPQARAADRQGVRGSSRTATARAARVPCRRRTRLPCAASRARLRAIRVGTARSPARARRRRAAAGRLPASGLARWLRRVAPARGARHGRASRS